MANIEIKFTTQDGSVFTDTPSLTVITDETFSVTSTGGAASLVFSPDLAAAVSPRPESPITLADGQSMEFTFTSDKPGGYFIAYGPVGLPVDAEFPPEVSNILYLQTRMVAMAPQPAPMLMATVTSTPPKGGTGPVLNPQGAD
jgi:hypothetical protein